MKKFYLSILFFLLPLVALAQQNCYTIKGTGDNLADGDTIYLCSVQGTFFVQRVDSTIVRNGEYRFTGSLPGCEMHYIIPVKNRMYAGLLVIILENTDFTIHSYDAYNKKEPDVRGGESHQLYRAFKEIQKKRSDEMFPLSKITRDSMVTQYDKLRAQLKVDSLMVLKKEEEFRFMTDHLPAPFCDLILGDNYRSFTPDQQKKALAVFKEKYPEGANYKRILSEMAVDAATGIGKKFTDFTMSDPDGKRISVGNFVEKNKYTLVDFWGSSCGPCRLEMPYVREAYQKYHDQGLEIIGVAIDDKHDVWVKAIASLNMPWPQMSDLKGWKSEGAKLYNIKSIPANILINNDGIIVARDLRGQTLINKIGELLKVKSVE